MQFKVAISGPRICNLAFDPAFRLRNPGTVPPFPPGKASSPCSRQSLNQVLTFLGLVGVLVDPTTAGIGDSDRAMGYNEPWDDDREN